MYKVIMNAYIALFLMFGLMFPSFIALAGNYNLPDLGSPSETILSQKQSHLLGLKFEAFIHEYLPLTHDELIVNYVNNIKQQLLPGTNLAGERTQVFVAKNPTINALAGPGNNIVINTGTLLATSNRSQLASVLAHELAHLNQRHLQKSIAKRQSLNWSTLAGILASVAVGATGNAQASQGALASVIAANSQSMISFTRSQEQEADNIGLSLLYQAGFDPRAMPEFFRKMQSGQYSSGEIPEFLQTHPLTTSRIVSTSQLASKYPQVNNNADDIEFYLIQQRIKVLVQGGQAQALRNDYQKRLHHEHQIPQQALRYGLALSYIECGQFHKASQIAETLHENYSHQVAYTLLYSQVLQKRDQSNHALDVLNQALELYPENRTLIARYAKLLLTNNQSQRAVRLLKGATEDYPKDAHFRQLLAKAYHQSHQEIRAKRTLAKYYALHKRWDLAAIQLKQLIENNDLNKLQHASIHKELERYQRNNKELKRMLNQGPGL